jgi:hypothetical protein
VGLLLVPLVVFLWLGGTRARQLVAPSDSEPRRAADEAQPEEAADARVLYGSVRDSAGEPIAGAALALGRHDRSAGSRTTSGADGGYRLTAVPLEAGELTASAEGYATQKVAVSAGEAGSSLRLDVTLEVAVPVAGVVYDPAGEPVADATVSCTDRPEEPMLGTHSDAEGRFELPDAAAGCRAVATHEAFGDSLDVELSAGDGNRLRLTAPASIAGVVSDERGSPITSYVVAVENHRTPEGSKALGKTGQSEEVSDAEGRFELQGLGPGSYVLVASADGRSPGRSERIELAAGEQRRGVRIRLTPGAVLVGVVRDAQSGAAIAGAGIGLDAVSYTRAGASRTQSDDEGNYRLEGVPADTFSVRVQAAGYRTLIVPGLTARSGATVSRDFELAAKAEGEDGGKGEVEYTGIGAALANTSAGVVVGQVFEGGPAERAGLQRNDVLLRVDGEDARHWTVAQAVQRLRGPEGTRVRVTIARGGEEREILIERERFVR